ncbi:MAG TPA: STAS domain-containing protein [Gammaproteobacteria bacterium]|nr:STAS domain-containing protein [Gammaproteobacteria bacterium]
MSALSLQEGRTEGDFRLIGELTVEHVPDLLPRSEKLLGDVPSVRVDLSAVTRMDSAGLALLVDWFGRARSEGLKLRFDNPPDQLLDIARVSGVDKILPFSRSEGVEATPGGSATSGQAGAHNES